MNSAYRNKMQALLSPAERRVLQKLKTPQLIQDYLEALPQHFVSDGDRMLSPRGVLAHNTAHCMEGAVFAAAALAYHGQPPFLMDFQTPEYDEDHVVAVFSVKDGSASGGKLWGALSKTNHPVLRWRDPIYKSIRELAMSYAHEYFMWNKKDGELLGKKTLRAYSKPFDLSRYAPEQWLVPDGISWLADPLDASPHSPVAPALALKNLRRATKVETDAMQLEEWSRGGKRLK